MRYFVAATLPMVRTLHESGALPSTVVVVADDALRARLAASDDDELAYLAMGEAALASLTLVAADPDAPPRRVVVAADDVPVRSDSVVSVHVDDDDAEPAVRAALEAVRASGRDGDAGGGPDSGPDGGPAGGPDAFEVLGEHDLMWFAAQEIPDLVAGLAAGRWSR